jgi:VWFA-related protein
VRRDQLLSFLSACAALLGTAVLSGQSPQGATPVFRSGVEIVRLDVSVLDKQRMPVRGLAAADFTVLEDGKPRPVVVFSAIDLADVVTERPAKWMREVTPDVATNRLDDRRIVVLVLDDATLPPDPAMVETTKRIGRQVIEGLGPGDLLSVVYTADNRRPQDFTTDRAKLSAAVERITGGISAHPWYLNASSIGTLNGVMEYLKTLPERRKVVVYVSVGVPIDHAAMAPVLASTLMNNSAVKDREQMLQLIDEMKRIFAQARPANVNVYAVDPSGLGGLEFYFVGHGVQQEAAHARAMLFLDYLQTVAGNTDGLAIINTNAPETRVAEIFRENQSYYLLGYEPVSGKHDGGLHRIEVKVDRPDVHVRSRNLTEAPSEKQDKDAKAAAPLAKALSGILPNADVPLSVTAAPFALPGGKTAAVVIALGMQQDLSGMPLFSRVAEAVDLRTSAFTLEGDPRETNHEKVMVTLLPGPGGDVRYDVLSRIDLRPGRYELRLAAYSGTLDKSGSVYVDVEVPDFAKAPVSLSGLVVGLTPAPASAPKDVVLSLLPFAPTSERTFRRTSRVVVFARVYQGGKSPLAPVNLTASILDDHDAKVFDQAQHLGADQFDPKARAADYRLEMPLRDLSPGAHVLIVETTLGKETARRDLVFEMR